MTKHSTFKTNDGVTLHYAQSGENNQQAIVCVHGWAQSADSFKFQVEGLGAKYNVIALDMRGHGESEAPTYGYSMFRMAKDVHDLLETLDLQDVIFMGHSMGCAVAWAYWTLFQAERLSKFILIDEMAAVAANPLWTEAELLQKGPIFDQTSMYQTYADMIGPNGVEASAAFVGPMFTDACDPEILATAMAESAKSPLLVSAKIFLNHCLIDWTDEIQTINIPTLVINGLDSHVPETSTIWVANAIPGSKLVSFKMEERAKHFMFLENPTKFNAVVTDFLEN